MTPADIDASLPNGFHDALLRRLDVDFAGAEVRFGFEFWVGDLDAETEEGREAMRPGVLRLTGMTSMSIEPPDARYQFSKDAGVRVDGDFGAYPGDPAQPEDGQVRLWLYASTWNSRMLFTAKECALELA